MLLIKLLVYLQNIFITQAAVMKIKNSPLIDQKYSYQGVYNDDDFKNDPKVKRQFMMQELPVQTQTCKEEIVTYRPPGRIECDPVPISQDVYIATHHNGDAFIERKSQKERERLQQMGQLKLPGKIKREVSSNLTANVNVTNNSSTVNLEGKDSYDKIQKLLHPDLDNFYDSELIRKLSDSNGKLPTSLKLVIPPDKEPIVVYNESEDDSFNNRNFIKREAVTSKSNIDYDYNYYEEQQQSDNSQLNSGPYHVRRKFPSVRVLENEQLRSPNITIEDNNKERNKPMRIYNNTELRASTPLPDIILSFDPLTMSPIIKEQIPKNRSRLFQITDNSGNDINIAIQRKATCPPPEAPGKKGCHPLGSGVPKYPIMPSLTKNEKDPEYDKLMRGETSERVIRTIVDKIHKNPSMAVELGLCDFDLSEMRSMFKKVRNREKKDCCSKLSGEMKCFLTWLLTLEPSRKKRAETQQEGTSHRFSTCKHFPKFDLLAGECYKKPSPQYEKLVQRVEEFRDENNVK